MITIKSRVRRLGYIFSTILVLTLTGACRSANPSPNVKQPSAIRVKLASVQSGTIREASEFIGTLESRRSVTLQPRIAGQVAGVLVRAGDRVKQGYPVLKIDAKQQQASVESRIAAVESTQADLVTAQAEAKSARADAENTKATLKALQARRVSEQSDLKLNQREYERFRQLYKEGATSQQTLDQRRNSLETARAKLTQTDADMVAQKAMIARAEAVVARAEATIVKNQRLINQAQANVEEQAAQLQFYTITAPFAGTVGNIPVKVGDYVSPSTPLVTVTQNQPLEVNISVPSEQSGALRLGMTVQLIDRQGNVIGNSEVFFISPNVNQQTESILLKALFKNTKNRLRADQQVLTRVIWDKHPGALIPATAVSRLGGKDFIFVAQSQGKSQLIVRQRPVTLGEIEGSNYQVIEGLKPGERIVVSGIQQLSDRSLIVPES